MNENSKKWIKLLGVIIIVLIFIMGLNNVSAEINPDYDKGSVSDTESDSEVLKGDSLIEPLTKLIYWSRNYDGECFGQYF